MAKDDEGDGGTVGGGDDSVGEGDVDDEDGGGTVVKMAMALQAL